MTHHNERCVLRDSIKVSFKKKRTVKNRLDPVTLNDTAL